MSDADYAKWKSLRGNADEVMSLVDEGRSAGNLAGWEILAQRAVAVQELANNFAKALLLTSRSRRLATRNAGNE
jgi:hypothetical protein